MFSLLCPPSLKKLEVGLLRLTHPLHVRHAGFLSEGGQSTELVLFQNVLCDSTSPTPSLATVLKLELGRKVGGAFCAWGR